MQDQELSVRNIPTPVPTRFLEKPLPKIIKSLIKPNITFIPKPSECDAVYPLSAFHMDVN